MADFSRIFNPHNFVNDINPSIAAGALNYTEGFISELDERTKMLNDTKLTTADGANIAAIATAAAESAAESAAHAMSGTPEGYADVVARANVVSHPNLIINSWFTINQRGWTSGKASANAYTVDRWAVNNANIRIDKTSDGIAIIKDVSNYGGQFFQKFEDFSSLAGKTVTVSAIVKNTTPVTMGISENGTTIKGMTITDTHDDWTLIYNQVKISDNITQLQFRIAILNASANGSVEIKAVKLEIGSVSTLAMDVAPNAAEELLKCQRYYFRLANSSGTNKDYLGIGFARDASYIMYDIILPTTMRVNPTISASANAISYTRNTVSNATNASSVGGYYASTNRRSALIGGNGLTAGTPYALYLAPNGYIELTAEL